MVAHRCQSCAALLLLLAGLSFADDDLVKSTVREAQFDEGPEEIDPAELEKRRPRTRKSVHPLTDIPPPGEWAKTSAHLVSHPDLTWKVGDEVTVLCYFKHRLNKDVNVSFFDFMIKYQTLQVTGLMGSLNSPVSFGYYLQNFSYDTEGYLATAHEDVTFDYVFKIGDTLDAGQWQVALTLYYQVGRLLYASTFFNETVTLVQPSVGSSWLLIFVSLFAFLCAAYYLGKDSVGQPASSSTRSEVSLAKARAEAAAAAQAAVDDDSWIAHLESKSHDTKQNQEYKPHNRKPTKKASKNKRK